MRTSRLPPPPPSDTDTRIAPLDGAAAMAQFIAAAPGKGAARPWLREGVRADVRVSFSMRIPEPLALKLDYLVDLAKDSGNPTATRNQTIVDALEAYAADALDRLGGNR